VICICCAWIKEVRKKKKVRNAVCLFIKLLFFGLYSFRRLLLVVEQEAMVERCHLLQANLW